MSNAYTTTAIALRDLKCFSIETESEKALLQSKVFLAQNIGLKLDYEFSLWYNTIISKDLIVTIKEQNLLFGIDEDVVFKEEYSVIINRVNAMEELFKAKTELSVVQWYQLLAIIAYKFETEDEELIFKRLQATKCYNSEQIRKGIRLYKKFKNFDFDTCEETKEEILADELLLERLEEENANQYVNEDAIMHHTF